MRSALLLPSQNALDQLSRFPRPSQERINYLVQEFRQQISNLMSLLVALRKVDLTHASIQGANERRNEDKHMCRNKEAQMMTEKTFSTEWINERNRSLARAGEGIVAARNSLDQLDDILRGTVAGKFPDIGTVVNITHRMREEINKILVSFVESSSVKDEEVF